MLVNKNIVLGITGCIAAYKAVDLASQLVKAGANVDVIMTEAATRFVAPLSFQALTHRPVVTDMFRLIEHAPGDANIGHVSLATSADLVAVVPATANTIAKMAHGFADNMLTTTILATSAPVLVAPAMDANMYSAPATQENLQRLRERGVVIVEPEYGRLASGLAGQGRLAEIPTILDNITAMLGRNGDLAGRRIVVTAGGTQEPIDPVRFVGNRSSGKMGFALAEAARDRGATVTLISGPVALRRPGCIEFVSVETAVQMRDAVRSAVAQADVLVMAAAVADFRAAQPAEQKIKKREGGALTVELVRNPDILGELKDVRCIKVGFAAESENLIANAAEKLAGKHLHMIVANDITAAESGFGSDTNRVVLLCADGTRTDLPAMPKREVAERILDHVVGLLADQNQPRRT